MMPEHTFGTYITDRTRLTREKQIHIHFVLEQSGGGSQLDATIKLK